MPAGRPNRPEKRQKKKSRPTAVGMLSILYQRMIIFGSDGTGNLSGTKATGASINATGRTVNDCFYSLYIRFPGTVGSTVRVRNLDTESDLLTADITFCHDTHLLV